nr:glycosyltransferase family 4 protein [Mucilaginibacter sp. L294]
MKTIRFLPQYIKAYKNIGTADIIYIRYPVPFGWLSKVYLKGIKRIIHFVGDPIDAARNNPNFSALKKQVLTSLFMPEHLSYMWACKGATTFTNGFHLAERLKPYGINATPLTSSTLKDSDFFMDTKLDVINNAYKLIYVGYLRKAKGVETVIKAFKHVADKYPMATLSVIGSGEFETELKEIVDELQIASKVTFVGHVDNRDELNNYYRTHDIFCFASLSEGSPRVILEAMANGLNIISTPVGALPKIFTHKEEILYANFNDDKDFFLKIDELIANKQLGNTMRSKAFTKIRSFTIQNFIKSIFHEG